jgi:ubiquinone/menaquinone biosynthesis C-methylase UbiE
MTSTTSQQKPAASDLDRLKNVQRAAWGAGDFALVARHTVFPGELLCEAVNIRAGQRVLDVATGSGNAALSAARRGAEAVGVDYVPGLLEWGRKRSAAEQLTVEFREGDCEALPFPDSSFDVVLSMFGAMFAPDHQRAADELVRVCRPGGQIALTSWTPSGFWGRVFALKSKFIPPPPGLAAAVAWGTEDHLQGLFGNRVTVVRSQLRYADFSYVSADDWLDFFVTYFGPMLKAFEQLDEYQRDMFATELKKLADESNCAEDAGLVIRGEYREVVLTKQ